MFDVAVTGDCGEVVKYYRCPVYFLVLNSFDKMAAISQKIFEMHFRDWKFCIFIKISLKFVPTGPIDNNPALV